MYMPEDITDFSETSSNEEDIPYDVNQLHHRLSPDYFIDKAVRNGLVLFSAQEVPAEARRITVLRCSRLCWPKPKRKLAFPLSKEVESRLARHGTETVARYV